MTTEPRKSILCPNCRRLVSRDETRCPHCGISNPGSKWKSNLWTRNIQEPEGVIRAVIYVNIFMYVVSLLFDLSAVGSSLMNPFTALSPASNSLFLLGASGAIPISGYGRWWTILSAAYLHGSLLHIIFNMIAFRHLSTFVIREYGIFRMLAIFTLSSIVGYTVSYFAGVRLTIGASAAVCGLIGAILYYAKSRGGTYGHAVYTQVSGWLMGLFLIGFMPGINNWAHGGGLVGGIAIGFLLGYSERRPEGYRDKAIAGACAAATLLVLLWALFTGFIYRFS